MLDVRNTNGFTLVEVLVTLAVTALMLTVIYQTVSSAALAREKLGIGNRQCHTARIVMERIGRELQSIDFNDNDERTRMTGGIGGGDMELLAFTSTASTPLAKEPGLPARISYQLEATGEGSSITYQLNRIESNSLAIEEGRAYKMADGLKDVQIGFLNNGNWVDRWDSQENGILPEAISLTLVIGTGSNENTFRTLWQIGDF